MRLRTYETTQTDTGRIATNVLMDEYGRIGRMVSNTKYTAKGKKIAKGSRPEWIPTGECGCANH